MSQPVYLQEAGWFLQRYELATGNTFTIAAQNVRREPTGIHGKLAIRMNNVTLAWSTFNLERDEDRVRLVNSAYGHLDPTANGLDIKEFPKNVLKHATDLFVAGLWAEVVASSKGELLEGDPDHPPATLILGDYIIDQGGHIAFAPPGRGKSYNLTLMAVSLDAGVETLWRLPHGSRAGRCPSLTPAAGRSMTSSKPPAPPTTSTTATSSGSTASAGPDTAT